MKARHAVTIFPILIAIIASCSGFSPAQIKSNNAPPATLESKPTTISKDILKARLAGKNVQFVEKLPDFDKPNPLFYR